MNSVFHASLVEAKVKGAENKSSSTFSSLSGQVLKWRLMNLTKIPNTKRLSEISLGRPPPVKTVVCAESGVERPESASFSNRPRLHFETSPRGRSPLLCGRRDEPLFPVGLGGRGRPTGALADRWGSFQGRRPLCSTYEASAAERSHAGAEKSHTWIALSTSELLDNSGMGFLK